MADAGSAQEQGTATGVTGLSGLSRRRLLWGVGALGLAAVAAACGGDGDDAEAPVGDGDADADTGGDAGTGVALAMFASPSCACCGSHAAYLEENGYVVDLQRTEELDAMRADLGVPEEAAGCHLAQVDGYVVEGHVPVAAIDRLRAEKPDVDGIALPGMPSGSPGMGDDPDATFDIVAFKDGSLSPFMTA